MTRILLPYRITTFRIFGLDPQTYFKVHGLPRYGVIGIVQDRNQDFYFIFNESWVRRWMDGKEAED